MNVQYLRTLPDAETIEVTGVFPHPVSRVWAAWTEADRLRRWMGAREGNFSAMTADVRVGGQWRFEISGDDEPGALQGEYLVVEAQERLVFTWSHVRETPHGVEATPTSRVSVEFRQLESGTEVRLRHEAILTEGGRRNVSHGWNASFERLAASL